MELCWIKWRGHQFPRPRELALVYLEVGGLLCLHRDPTAAWWALLITKLSLVPTAMVQHSLQCCLLNTWVFWGVLGSQWAPCCTGFVVHWNWTGACLYVLLLYRQWCDNDVSTPTWSVVKPTLLWMGIFLSFHTWCGLAMLISHFCADWALSCKVGKVYRS